MQAKNPLIIIGLFSTPDPRCMRLSLVLWKGFARDSSFFLPLGPAALGILCAVSDACGGRGGTDAS